MKDIEALLMSHGLNLRFVGGQLQVGPKEKLNSDLLKTLKTNKSQVLKSDIVEYDPRLDLYMDSDQWATLLMWAYGSPLFYVLHGFRCQGARLLKGHIVYDKRFSGYSSRTEYDQDYTKWLKPVEQQLSCLLDRLPCKAHRNIGRQMSLIDNGINNEPLHNPKDVCKSGRSGKSGVLQRR